MSEDTITGNYHVEGRLHLGFVYDHAIQATRMQVLEQHQPLQVVRAFPQVDGAALVHVHNLSGGVLGGDQLQLQVEVGARANAQLTTTSATRLYRSRPNACAARQTTEVRVQAGGLLEYLPDPLIPFARARYQQRTRIELEEDSGLFWWETLAPGRTAHGEVFAYDLLQIDLDIMAHGRPLAVERFKLEPRLRPLDSPARLGPYLYMCSFYICRVGLEAACWTSLEQELSLLARELSVPGETHWGVTALVAHGLLVRVLSQRGQPVSKGLHRFWQHAKQALYGRDAIAPRKIE